MPSLEKFELALLFVITFTLFITVYNITAPHAVFTVITLAISEVLISFKLLRYHN